MFQIYIYFKWCDGCWLVGFFLFKDQQQSYKSNKPVSEVKWREIEREWNNTTNESDNIKSNGNYTKIVS